MRARPIGEGAQLQAPEAPLVSAAQLPRGGHAKVAREVVHIRGDSRRTHAGRNPRHRRQILPVAHEVRPGRLCADLNDVDRFQPALQNVIDLHVVGRLAAEPSATKPEHIFSVAIHVPHGLRARRHDPVGGLLIGPYAEPLIDQRIVRRTRQELHAIKAQAGRCGQSSPELPLRLHKRGEIGHREVGRRAARAQRDLTAVARRRHRIELRQIVELEQATLFHRQIALDLRDDVVGTERDRLIAAIPEQRVGQLVLPFLVLLRRQAIAAELHVHGPAGVVGQTRRNAHESTRQFIARNTLAGELQRLQLELIHHPTTERRAQRREGPGAVHLGPAAALGEMQRLVRADFLRIRKQCGVIAQRQAMVGRQLPIHTTHEGLTQWLTTEHAGLLLGGIEPVLLGQNRRETIQRIAGDAELDLVGTVAHVHDLERQRLIGAIVHPEHGELVLDDGAAQAEALLAHRKVLRSHTAIVVGGEALVAIVRERRATPAIGAGLGHGIDQATALSALGDIVFVGGDLELANRFHAHGQRTGEGLPGVVHLRPHAINAHVGAHGARAAEAGAAARERRQLDQILETAVRIRQLFHLLFTDARDRAVPFHHAGRIGRHGHLGELHGAHDKTEVGGDHTADVERDAFTGAGAKADGTRGDAIGTAEWQLRRDVAPAIAAADHGHEAGGGVADLYDSTRHRGASAVGDDATDTGVSTLSEQRVARREERDEERGGDAREPATEQNGH